LAIMTNTDVTTLARYRTADQGVLLDLVRSNPLDLAVGSCPGWTLADLAAHLGGVYRWAAATLELGERAPRVSFTGGPGELPDWLGESTELIEAALVEHAPDDPAWTFGPDDVAVFWHRRMTHETSIHRWDAQTAIGDPAPVDPALAVDGVDEIMDVIIPLKVGSTMLEVGQSVHLHATDVAGEWLIVEEADGLTISRRHGKGTVAARGTASDLLLFVTGRLDPAHLEVFGDAAVLGVMSRACHF